MNKNLMITISISATILVLVVLLFITNFIRAQDAEKQNKTVAQKSQGTSQIQATRDSAEPEILPYKVVSRLASNFTKRLVDGSKVYSLDQQDILNNNLQDYYNQNAVSCNINKCLIVESAGDAIRLDQQIISISSFSYKGVDYWVNTWLENDQYSLTVSKVGLSETKKIKFDKKVKAIVEIGTERGIYEIQYVDSTKETLNLKTKI
jgi:uncharacterized membrane protein